MAVGVLYAIIIIAAVIFVATQDYTQPEQASMEPNNLDSFSVTKAQEGSIVPYVVGENRITGNFLWYGNLTTEKVTETVEGGGKGGGGGSAQQVTKGYNYYLDIWQGLCLGPGVTIDNIYVNDNKRPSFGDFNDGSSDYVPDVTGMPSEISKLPGVAHLFCEQYFIGFNATQVPTFHYIVTRTLDSFPYPAYTEVSYGMNPAAIIHDILIRGGATNSNMNLSTFEDAAEYWHTKGYGLSFNWFKQEKVKEYIRRVLSYVDGAFYLDGNDQFNIVPFKETDSYVAEVETKEFLEFGFSRRSWDDVACDFRGNYIDRDQDFTKRSLRAQNLAVAQIVGNKKPVSIDLTAFTDITAASKRLFEIMKKASYPEATVQCKLPMDYIAYEVGEILRISHDDHGIVSADFRIISKDISGVEENWVGFSLTEFIDGLFDDNYAQAADPLWENPSYAPQPVVHQRIFEMPFNSYFTDEPAYLVLMQREAYETGAVIMISQTGSDYEAKADVTTWSQHGTIVGGYSSDTIAIDDETGLLFAPSYREDPVFETVSRAALFTTPRLVVVNDEIMAFESISYEGNYIRLLGVIRGLYNTEVATHDHGDEVWVTKVDDNVLSGILLSSFYVKALPYFGSDRLDESSATPESVTYTAKAKDPLGIAQCTFEDTGTDWDVEVWTIRKLDGAGLTSLTVETDLDQSWVTGEYFEYKFSSTVYTSTSPSFTFPDSYRGSADTISVRMVSGTYASEWKTISGFSTTTTGDIVKGPDYA